MKRNLMELCLNFCLFDSCWEFLRTEPERSKHNCIHYIKSWRTPNEHFRSNIKHSKERRNSMELCLNFCLFDSCWVFRRTEPERSKKNCIHCKESRQTPNEHFRSNINHSQNKGWRNWVELCLYFWMFYSCWVFWRTEPE